MKKQKKETETCLGKCLHHLDQKNTLEKEKVKVTIATYEETVERLKNEKYQVVSPLRYRRSISNSPKNKGGKHGKDARSILE